jgi:hypothetical protein
MALICIVCEVNWQIVVYEMECVGIAFACRILAVLLYRTGTRSNENLMQMRKKYFLKNNCESCDLGRILEEVSRNRTYIYLIALNTK